MHPFLASIGGALAVVLAASVASANDTPDPVRAAALFAEGRQSMAAGDYATACPKLAESQALDPAADTALDLGICYQNASQAAFKVAHELAGTGEGSSAVALAARAPAPEPEAPATGHTQRIVGLTLGTAGVVGGVVGVILGFVAKAKADHAVTSCPGGVCASASSFAQLESAVSTARAANISIIAGLAALGGGAIVYFTAPRPRTIPAPTVGLGPAAEGAGLAVAGQF